MNESKNLRDLLGGVISGVTINVLTASATDLVRSVIDETGNYLKVSGSGTAGSGSSGISGSSGVSGTSGSSGVSGSFTGYSVNDISADATGITMNYYRVSGETISFWLPPTSDSGDWIIVKNINSTLTVYPDSTNTIDLLTSKVMNNGDSITLIDASSTRWDIV